ncbi:MAG: glycosyltransferase family A protein [Bacteroidota bacterium]
MDSPTVSVLIGAYNAAPWIGETLRSVFDQTYPHLEVVIVDDGSTDGTLAAIEAAASGTDRDVTILSQENRGACATRNRAFEASTGDLIQYLDADDLLHPQKIERQVRRLAQQPFGTVASGPWTRFQDEIPADLTAVPRESDWRDYEPATDWLVQSWGGDGTIPLFAWLIPRAIAEAAGPWVEGLLRNQDGEYMARILVETERIAFCEGAWGFYRTSGSGSVSARRGRAIAQSLADATERCERTLLGHKDSEAHRRAASGLWQMLLFEAYPTAPDLVRQAEARIEALGGMYRTPGVSRPLRPIRDYVGWKAAVRLQRLYNRVLR